MKYFLEKISCKENLTLQEARDAMRIIMEGSASDTQIAGFLLAMKTKGEHSDELLGFVEVMREKSLKIFLEDENAIDVCGTGGDGSGTFNISTVVAFVVAGAEITVAKHGNRSVSGACGSADVLRALGVNIELSPERVQHCINTTGIGFLFAPMFHPSMKFAAKVRAELGIKTCFNLLGPLTNPAGVQRQLIGVYNREVQNKMAKVYEQLPHKKICYVHSDDELDEISLNGITSVIELNVQEEVKDYSISASSFGIDRTASNTIAGGDSKYNAEVALSILQGEKSALRDIVLLNAAMALYIADKVTALTDGIVLSRESIDSGRALQKLNILRKFSTQ